MKTDNLTTIDLDAIREDLLRGVLRIGVFGEFSAGKSTFLNALLGEELLTVATEPTTALPTEVVYGGAFNVRVLGRDGSDVARLYAEREVPFWARLVGRGLLDKLKAEGEKVRTFVRTWSAEGGRATEGAMVRIEWPQPFLRQKLALVDTPGTNVDIDRHGEMTHRVASQVDIAICLVDARHGLKGTSLRFIQDIAPMVGELFVVLNKIDCIDAEERQDLLEELHAILLQAWPAMAAPLAGVHPCSSLLPFDEILAKRHPDLSGLILELKDEILKAIRQDRGRLILRRNGDPLFRLADAASAAESSGDLHAEHEALREALELCHEAEILPSDELLRAMASCEERLGQTVHEESQAQDLLAEAITMLKAGRSTPKSLAQALEMAAASLQRTNHRDESIVEAFALALEAHRELRSVLVEPMRAVVPQPWVDSFAADLERLLDDPDFSGSPELEQKARIGGALEIPAAWALQGTMMIFKADGSEERPGRSASTWGGYQAPQEDPAKQGLRWVQKAAASGDPLSMWILGRLHAIEDGPAKYDLKEAMAWYLRAAEKGLQRAQLQIAECLMEGVGTEKSPREALRWYRKAAEGGHPLALNDLGAFLALEGPLCNLSEALQCYRQAAEQGFAIAQTNLALALLQGTLGEANPQEGVVWLKRAADQGMANAQNALAICLRDGLGCAQDLEESFRWLRLAAEQGFSVAEDTLARYYADGIGVPQNLDEALRWFERAAEHGDPDSLLTLGLRILEGEDPERDPSQGFELIRKAADLGNSEAMEVLGDCTLNGLHVQKDPKVAVEWFRKAAELGNPSAQLSLAECLEEGIGIKEDLVEAMSWLRRSVELGHARARLVLGFCFLNGDAVQQDHAEAVRLFRLAADQGNPQAQNALALCLERGEGVRQDSSEAVMWYRKAAEQGLEIAQINLALSYRDGTGVPQDLREAAFWLRKAAEQGNAAAQDALGEFYKEGQGVPKSFHEAVTWFRKAAEQGNASGQTNLGLCHLNGEGVSENALEAAKCFRKAAEQDNVAGQFFLALLLQDGRGVRADAREAANWFRKAADQGLSDAQNALGWMYRNGSGIPQNHREAFACFEKAADQGDLEARTIVGLCYENGEGVSQHLRKAVEHYTMAAEQGFHHAQLNLANCYRAGRGVPQNHAQAVQWFRKAADSGNVDAQTWLGICYANGEGVPQNMDIAKRYLHASAEQGDSEAVEILNKIKESESSCFITTASAHILDWEDQGPELTAFRAFRDQVMRMSEAGRQEVELYYRIAPRIVERVLALPTPDRVWGEVAERYLLPIHQELVGQRGETAHEHYRSMVLDLASRVLTQEELAAEPLLNRS